MRRGACSAWTGWSSMRGSVTVIDFKTGVEEPAAHEAQVRDYMRVLSEVYPAREVSALLAYVDHATVRSIT